MTLTPAILTSVTGWVTTGILCAQIAFPFWLRTTLPRLAKAGGSAARGGFWQSMKPHYAAGFALPALSFYHAWIPMASGHMPRTSMTGLWLATFAMGLLFVQVLLGAGMWAAKGATAGVLRRTHLGIMLVAAVLIGFHLLLN